MGRQLREIARRFGGNWREYGRRLEEIKQGTGRGPADIVDIDVRTGDVRDPRTGEVLGNLLE